MTTISCTRGARCARCRSCRSWSSSRSAIGIGANTVVFSWLQMVRWKPLPGVPAADALQTIEPRTDAGVYVGASWLEYRDLRRASRRSSGCSHPA